MRINVTYRCILCLVLFQIGHYSSLSQVYDEKSRFNIHHLGVNDGLSQGSVYSVLQDSEGYMWMTSFEGLNRYDGSHFFIFSENPNDNFSLVGNSTLGLVEHADYIWVGSEKCLNRYDKTTGQFTQVYTITSQDAQLFNRHYPIYADAQEVWYINEIEGIMRYNFISDKKEFISSEFKYKRNEFIINSIVVDQTKSMWLRQNIGIAKIKVGQHVETDYYYSNHPENRFGQPEFIYAMHIDKSNRYYFSTDRGIIHLDFEQMTEQIKLDYDRYQTPASSICFDDKNRLWIGTNDKGLWMYDPHNTELINFNKHLKGKNRLVNNSPSHLFLDRNGLIWVSTDPDGICILTEDNKPFEKFDEFNWQDQIIYPFGTRCFEELANGVILLGTQDDGIRSFDPKTNELTEGFILENYPENHAGDLLLDSYGWLWIATYNGVYVVKKNSNQAEHLPPEPGYEHLPNRNNAWYLFEDHRGNILYGTNSGLFHVDRNTFKITKSDIVADRLCKFICTDSFGNLLATQESHGIAVMPLTELYNVDNSFNTQPEYQMFFNHELNINSLMNGNDRNRFWASTTTGLFEIVIDSSWSNPNISKFYGRQHGMPSAFLYGSIMDNMGLLWISSNRGIFSLNPISSEIKIYGPVDGLQGNEFNTNAYFRTTNGDFYFGGVTGFNKFKPGTIRLDTSLAPKPIIQAVHINNSDRNLLLSPTSELTNLRYDQNTLQIAFVSTDFRSNGQNSYKYRLKTHRQDWTLQEGNQQIRYTNISPGQYTFEIKAANGDGFWNEESTELLFIISPPWWQTWWFRGAAILLVGLTIGTLVRLRIKRVQANEQIRGRLAQLQLSALQSQMNPHFIFNCMNTIDGFIAINDRRKASDFIASFSKLIRKSLELSRSTFIPLEEEFTFIKAYIDLEQKRFDRPFDVIFDIRYETNLKERLIPPMAIQPIVENAIWHGIVPLKSGGILTIADEFDNNDYFISIADNGKGMASSNSSTHKSLGTSIIKERFELINRSSKSPYRIENRSSDLKNGTKICIFIPTPEQTKI